MTQETSAADRIARISKSCKSYFEKHVIIKQSEDRYLIQKLYPDGKPMGDYAAEIICLWNRQIYVGGDIGPMVFGYGDVDPISRLYWIGRQTNLDYVGIKASIGMRESQEEWDNNIMRFELKDRVTSDPEDYEILDQDAYESMLEADTQEELYTHADAAFGNDCWEWVGSLGMVLNSQVLCAHAAIAKLCDLLDEQDNDKNQAKDKAA